jgi:1,4-alpha-glucan branching enzyme
VSSAAFWLDFYHIDGIRVDAVASMLYLDYSRGPGEWIPNTYGGRENLEAIHFLRQLNHEIHRSFPGAITIAEESTAWPRVSRPAEEGGLGFDFKWDMGWMHDTLKHFARDPIHRRYHQNDLTFRGLYGFNENFVLPLSHDEVVHMKKSLLDKMWGDEWQRYAGLRSLVGYQFAVPGKKLLFMGGEWGQGPEWNHDKSLDWHELDWDYHRGMLKWTSDAARLYLSRPSLHWGDCNPAGFEWISCDDADNGILAWVRWNHDHRQAMLCVIGLTPVARFGYRLGFPWVGPWKEVLNSDASHYGGSNVGNAGVIQARPERCGVWSACAEVTIPPLGIVYFEGTLEG